MVFYCFLCPALRTARWCSVRVNTVIRDTPKRCKNAPLTCLFNKTGKCKKHKQHHMPIFNKTGKCKLLTKW